MMDYDLEFIVENGENDNWNITVYALSTCGFCKRGLEFLRKNSIKFRYVYVDNLPFEVKDKLKEDLEAKYNKRFGFPYLIKDEKKVIVGFSQEEWEREFNE
jgi:glutaredoxin-like protein NrdH